MTNTFEPAQQSIPIHISDVLAFKQCRRLWNWTSPLRQCLTPIRVYAPFFTGRLIHHCLEFRYKFGTPFDVSSEVFMRDYELENRVDENLWNADLPLIEAELQLARSILAHYDLWQAKDTTILSDSEFDFIELERKFVAPIRTLKGRISSKFHNAGRFDGVVYHKTQDRYYLWEIKTTEGISGRIKQLALEEQADTYTLAAQEILGIKLSGIVYTLICKKLPEYPTELKDGHLSLNKAINTSPEYLIECIRAHYGEITPAVQSRYEPLVQALLDQPHKFFQRVIIRRSQSELKSASNELFAVASEMVKPRVPIYKTAGYHCNRCLFREPCLMLQNGQDPTSLINHNFMLNSHYLKDNENENSS